MKKILKKRILELIVVVILIAILLTLFIPKFMDAQVTAKITQAKRDLNSIYKAAKLYQKDLKDAFIYNVSVFNDRRGKTVGKSEIFTVSLKPKTPFDGLNRIDDTSDFEHYLPKYPIQQLPLDMKQDTFTKPVQEVKNNRIVTTNTFYYYGFKYEQIRYQSPSGIISKAHLPDFSNYILRLSNFTIQSDTWSFTSTPGPVLQPGLKTHIEFDITNGLLSHGMIVQHTALKDRRIDKK